jgi:hypothetical protein
MKGVNVRNIPFLEVSRLWSFFLLSGYDPNTNFLIPRKMAFNGVAAQ